MVKLGVQPGGDGPPRLGPLPGPRILYIACRNVTTMLCSKKWFRLGTFDGRDYWPVATTLSLPLPSGAVYQKNRDSLNFQHDIGDWNVVNFKLCNICYSRWYRAFRMKDAVWIAHVIFWFIVVVYHHRNISSSQLLQQRTVFHTPLRQTVRRHPLHHHHQLHQHHRHHFYYRCH